MRYVKDIEFLKHHLVGFDKERKDVQEKICKLLFHGHRKHNLDPTAYVLNKEFITKHVGMKMDTFYRINEKYELFEFEKYYQRGSARKMWTTQKYKTLLKDLCKSKTKQVMTVGGKSGRIRNIPESLPKSDFITVGGMKVKSKLELDMDALEHYMDTCENPSKLERARALYLFASDVRTGEGVLVQDFKVGSTGRVTGRSYSLQYVDRDIRDAALNGMYDYDLVNCHYAILAQNGLFPAIQHYVDNAKEVRESLAEQFGITYDQAKQLMIALGNGAGRGKKGPIAKIIGEGYVDSFFQIPLVKSIHQEALESVNTIYTPNSPFAPKISLYSAHQYVTPIEAMILEGLTDGEVVTLPMFDGFISPNALDTDELEAMMPERFNVRTKIKRRKIDYWGKLNE